MANMQMKLELVIVPVSDVEQLSLTLLAQFQGLQGKLRQAASTYREAIQVWLTPS